MVPSSVEEVRCCTQCRAIYRADFARCPTDGALLELRTDDPLIGVTVGEHYVIDGLVGEGGMGRVYRAHHTRLNRRNFAIKILLGDLAATIATRMRFAQEADAASRLDHPNVVPVVDFGKTHTGLMFLAMELVTGRTLGSLIEQEAPLAPDRVIALARQMCSGLAHAHSRELVHRDFKPDNVMVVETEGGEVPRILDFGLAITPDEEQSARLTTVGIALGTPTYASPEQTHGDNVDARADLFALGVTMYEMLCGKTPHDGTAVEVIRLNARAAPPPLASKANVVVPAALEALVFRLLARKPEDRFDSATAVIAALDALATTVEPDPAATLVVPMLQAAELAAPVLPPAPRRRRWPWIAAVGALVAGSGIALLASSMVSPGRAPTTGPALVASPMTVPSVAAPSTGSSVAAPLTGSPGTEAPSELSTPTAPIIVTPSPPAPGKRPRPAPRTPERVAAGSARPETPAVAIVEPTRAEPLVPPPAPVVVTPPPEVVTRIAPPPVAPPVRVAPPPAILSRAALASVTARGSLSTAVVRRAVERAMPEIADCARRAAVTSTASSALVRATFVIDDSRRATKVSISGGAAPALAGCVTRALANVRTADPPDVGTVAVSLDVSFTGGPT